MLPPTYGLPAAVLIVLGGTLACFAGYRLFRRSTLGAIDLGTVESSGYCFQTDLAWRTSQAGLRIVEVPIEFVERVRGESKMDRRVATESLRRITAWGVAERRRQARDVLSKVTRAAAVRTSSASAIAPSRPQVGILGA